MKCIIVIRGVSEEEYNDITSELVQQIVSNYRFGGEDMPLLKLINQQVYYRDGGGSMRWVHAVRSDEFPGLASNISTGYENKED